jgi:hypothetical protein
MSRKKTKARKPKKAQKGTCFVIMPFGGWLDDYYQDIYCPAIKSAGLVPHRADDLFRPSTIVNDIWLYTKKARLVLADLSGKNPNVFYELGLAHALAKPAILVAESMEDVPFDLRALRVLVYDKNAPDWGDILREKVKNSIDEVLKVPAEAVLPAFLDKKGVSAKVTSTPHIKEVMDLRQQIDLLREEVRNPENDLHVKQIGPTEARTRIRSYLRRGMSEASIIRRLVSLGAPQGWVVKEIQELKPRKSKRK